MSVRRIEVYNEWMCHSGVVHVKCFPMCCYLDVGLDSVRFLDMVQRFLELYFCVFIVTAPRRYEVRAQRRFFFIDSEILTRRGE